MQTTESLVETVHEILGNVLPPTTVVFSTAVPTVEEDFQKKHCLLTQEYIDLAKLQDNNHAMIHIYI